MSFSSDNPLQSNQLPISLDIPENEFIREFLDNTLKRVSNTMNTKEGSYYLLQELASFKQLYTRNNAVVFRNGYRRVFDLVALNAGNIGAGATVVFPHGIDTIVNTLFIYANCTSVTPEFFTVVYPQIFVDSVNITFTNPLGVALTQADAVVEYTKN